VIGLTSFISREAAVAPTLKERRARFILARIDEILAWESNIERDKDMHFVELLSL
jgi:hypothetical protein